MTDQETIQPERCGGCCSVFRTVRFRLYCSHALSAWGDRMWQFAVGMLLASISPNSLRLTAIYGFSSGGAVLLGGALLGHMVDSSRRLPTVRWCLAVQNIFTAISAVASSLVVYFPEAMTTTWDGWLLILLEVIIIVTAVIADLGSVVRVISIERDWIVVICETNDELTEMSAFLRRIDLTTNIVAPIATGFVLTYGSLFAGSLFLAGWNVVSLFVEYAILLQVYKAVPALANKNTLPSGETAKLLPGKGGSTSSYGACDSAKSEDENLLPEDVDYSPRRKPSTSKPTGMIQLLLEPFAIFVMGWRTYMQQSIVLAGISLSTLYMTVVGFDNITTGYAKQQGLSESMISLLMAAGALVGILATVCYPMLRRRIGLEWTGMLAFALEVLCLSFAVLSVFAPGSAFDPTFSPNSFNSSATTSGPISPNVDFQTEVVSTFNISLSTLTPDMTTTVEANTKSMISISILMVGIVSSRIGLWMADLTVTQLLLETPPENVRGVVNGVQNSLNKFMDILKFLLVILLPWPETFGYLIMVSLAFIVGGGVLYTIYAAKELRKLRT